MDNDHIYYDLGIVNSQATDAQLRNYPELNKLNFTEVRSSPILLNPSEYYLSIVRFTLDTALALPAFIPQIVLDQPFAGNPNYPNETIYFITFAFPDPLNVGPTIYKKQQIIYVPQYTPTHQGNSGIPATPFGSPIPLSVATSNYYWVSDFKNFIIMINTALQIAWTDILALAITAGYAQPVDALIQNAPFLEWDTDKQLCTLYAPIASFRMADDIVADGAPIQLFFNTSLFTLFSSFQANFNGSLIDTQNIQEQETNYRIRIYADKNKNILVPTGPAGLEFPPFTSGAPLAPSNAIQMIQSFQTGATMCPITQIIFNTSLIPCATTLVGIPRISNSIGLAGVQTQNDNFSNQITDLVVNLTTGYEYLPNIIYEPTAQYRYIDLQSNTPLYGIQISVSWKDIYGTVHDFYLSNNQGTSLKVLFSKRSSAL